MFFWLKRFKKPSEQYDKKLFLMYNALNDANKAIVDKKANKIINVSICLYAILFFIFVGLFIFLSVMKVEAMFSLFVAICSLLPVYCVWSASTWKKAQPHQKIMLVQNYVYSLLNNRGNNE